MTYSLDQGRGYLKNLFKFFYFCFFFLKNLFKVFFFFFIRAS
jgi:hypothetical protein